MNIAKKIILSVWGPAVVIFPLAMIKVTGVYKMGEATWGGYYHLYQAPWFWYFCIIATGVFLLRFWGSEPLVQEQKQQEGLKLEEEQTGTPKEDMNTIVTCSKCGVAAPRSKAIRIGEDAICLKCYI